MLVDEVGLETNLGLPYVLGLGASCALKLRGVPVYPSCALKVGVGPIVKTEFLLGLNYRKAYDLTYTLNFGHSGGESFTFDTHGGGPDKFAGMAMNLQRRKYIGASKYWCFSQLVGFDLKRRIESEKEPEYYLYPYFEVGFYFMIL